MNNAIPKATNVERKQLLSEMADSPNYSSWVQAAKAYDSLLETKGVSQQELFGDMKSITGHLSRLRAGCEYQALCRQLSEIFSNEEKFFSPHISERFKFQKVSPISAFDAEIKRSLITIVRASNDEVADQKKLLLEEFERAAGNIALMLSGGGVLGYQHLGVVRALLQQNLLPDIISGASAGSIITAILGTHSETELLSLLTPDVFYPMVASAANGKSRLNWNQVESVVNALIPDLTFQQAFNKSGYKINVSVANTDHTKGAKILNVRSTPDVLVRSAVLASCAFPGVYPPVQLYQMDCKRGRVVCFKGELWSDGSFVADLPVAELESIYGVTRTVVSMVNPLVSPFQPLLDRQANPTLKRAGEAALALSRWAIDHVHGITNKESNPVGDRIAGVKGLINQSYQGDINIRPQARRYRVSSILSGVSQAELTYLIDCGEKATYPHIEVIRRQSQLSKLSKSLKSKEY
jgi:predicted acylesterase/phospholipase RssA